MERLTMWHDGNHAICTDEHCTLDNCPFADAPCEHVQEVIDRLAAYEDTGLTPADLPRAAELLEADMAGQCVVLDEPRKPLVWDDDRDAVRCPDCGTDLMGIPYGERILLQCPECGQYIDGTKAITRAEAEAALSGGEENGC